MDNELAKGLVAALERIADSHERMVMIAMEAREERLKLADAMKERMKAGFAAEK